MYMCGLDAIRVADILQLYVRTMQIYEAVYMYICMVYVALELPMFCSEVLLCRLPRGSRPEAFRTVCSWVVWPASWVSSKCMLVAGLTVEALRTRARGFWEFREMSSDRASPVLPCAHSHTQSQEW